MNTCCKQTLLINQLLLSNFAVRYRRSSPSISVVRISWRAHWRSLHSVASSLQHLAIYQDPPLPNFMSSQNGKIYGNICIIWEHLKNMQIYTYTCIYRDFGRFSKPFFWKVAVLQNAFLCNGKAAQRNSESNRVTLAPRSLFWGCFVKNIFFAIVVLTLLYFSILGTHEILRPPVLGHILKLCFDMLSTYAVGNQIGRYRCYIPYSRTHHCSDIL